jgi:hypothetical protein
MDHSTHRIALCILLYSLGFSLCTLRAATTTLINFGSPWRYNDFGVDPGANWFTTAYPDGNWLFNFSQFGYGEGDEATETEPANTTYFRYYKTITDAAAFSSFTLRLLRDDGAVVYINGTEVVRNNLPPTGALNYGTAALSSINGAQESALVVTSLPPSLFVSGPNLIAVAIHQASPDGGDMSFNLELTATVGTNPVAAASIVRGPYLQVATSSNIIVRWRTSTETDSLVRFGTTLGSLNKGVTNYAQELDHEIKLTGLVPDTKYFYAIGTSTQLVAGDAGYFFVTAPAPGVAKPMRIWAIGDFGTGFMEQTNVRNAYTNFTGTRHTDAWLFLGDNAYYTGLDSDYQSYVFNVYSNELRRMVVWPTVGNHETAFSPALSDNYDYYRIFTMPTAGEAGGVPSGTEHFYSYDYGNIHFVVLDSMTAIFREPNSVMAQWLKTDLADTTRDWVIVYFHHPPYTKGSHDSDVESDLVQVRANILPILEAGGVDLVLTGHSHCYERSFLIDGFYGGSTTATAMNFLDHGDGRTNGTGAYSKPAGGLGANRGVVYIVDGSSGGQGGGGLLNHPAMYYSVLTPGSLVIDIDGLRLDGTFVSGSGTVDDTFTIIKGDYPGAPRPQMNIARAGTNAVIAWPTSVPDYRLESKAALAPGAWSPVATVPSTNGRRKTVTVPARGTNEFFQLRRVP